MSNYVITIAREYGSGGRTIGKRLAKELGWDYYDRELLRMASDESGINEELFAKADETVKRTSLFKAARAAFTGGVIPPDREDFISNENLFRYQAKIIRELASTRSCVIIGRCANYILQDMENVVNIYVHASFDKCTETVMDMFGMTREAAEKKIRDTDKRREDYYRYFTGHSWKNADYYDLCLDSFRLGWDKCLALVKAYMSIRFDDFKA